MEFNGTFLATIITFIVFVLLMNIILYKPVLTIMEKRKTVIDENYKLAEENKAKASELEQEKNIKLAEAKEDAKSQYNDILTEFKTQRADIVASAQNTAREDVERSKIELENVSNEVKSQLKGSMRDLANDIVEKVIGYRSEVQNLNEDAVNKVLWD